MTISDLQFVKSWSDATLLDLLSRFIDESNLTYQALRYLRTIPSHQESNAKPELTIKRVISRGELSFDTYNELLESAARALDKACSHDILGEVLFEATDGKIYITTVEAVVDEASPTFIAMIEEDQMEGARE